MKLLIKVMYDGRAYHGFQVQPNGISVQEVLCRAASAFFGFQCSVTGCSRTDSGVHATGFCAAVEPAQAADRTSLWCSVPIGKIHRALSPYLPDDVSVIAAAEVQDDFHPRYCAVEKEYIYKIWDEPYMNPFFRQRAHAVRKKMSDDDIALMNDIAAVLRGTHDFSSFMSAGSKIECAVRTVTNTLIKRASDGTVNFYISADGFLYNMVRIIMGTLIELTGKGASPQDMKLILDKKNRSAAGATAPPCGLYLNRVEFDRKINWECV